MHAIKPGRLLSRANRLPENKLTPLVFLLSFAAVFLVAAAVGNSASYFDDEYYLFLSNSFTSTGSFRLFSFPESYRGAVFPLLLYFCMEPFRRLGLPQIMGWWALVSFCAALIVAALPHLLAGFCVKKPGLAARLVPLACLLFFWYGLVVYVLSDLVALAFLVLGIVLLQAAFKRASFAKAALCALLSGLALYAAYNTRTIYLFPILLLVPATLFLHRGAGAKKLLAVFLAALLGLAALGSLEGALNLHRYGSFSPLVQTSAYQGENLFLTQLRVGFSYSQYETYIGDKALYADGSLVFIDPVGREIIGRYADSDLSPFAILLRHPFSFAGVYLRHFLNMLNPVWGGGAFIKDLYAFKFHRTLINYTLMFLVSAHVITRLFGQKARAVRRAVARRREGFLAALVILLPCVFILPGAVELRFFLPMYVLLYGYAAFAVDYRALLASLKKHPVLTAFCYLGLLCLLCAVWASTYANTWEGVVLSIF